MYKKNWTSILELTKLLGLLSATIQAVVPTRLQIRNLQQLQIQASEIVEVVANECKIDSLSERGTALVDVELTAFKWEAVHPESSKQGVNLDRCLKKGVGSSMQRSYWLVVQGGTTASYQCPGTSSNKTSFVDIQQVRINQINSLPNRHQNSNFLSIENGGHNKPNNDNFIKRDLRCFVEKEHNYFS